MVRLRREIEGIAVNAAVPDPAHSGDPDRGRLTLPALDAQLDHLDARRVLLAGVVHASTANRLAANGHMVTVADVGKAHIRQFHSQIDKAHGTKVSIVNKPYGDATFGPSSFDAIIHLDGLHRFTKPAWAVAKAYRELKFDGVIVVRALVNGLPPRDVDVTTGATGASPWATKAIERLKQLGRSRVAGLFLDARGRDAVDRGAHLADRSFAIPWTDAVAALTEKMALQQHWAGHSQRLAAVSLLYGARQQLTPAIDEVIANTPRLADEVDLATGNERVVGIVVKKKLGFKR